MKEGDMYVLSMEKKDELKDFLTGIVADTQEERIKLLLIEAQIAAWAKGGKASDRDAQIYFRILYDELKKIRERNLNVKARLQR